MADFALSRAIRVQPYTGLVIDVNTWASAHDYHRRHHQLHLASLHGSGVASGLDVLPTDPPSDTVVVERGLAIDQLGNVIVVPESQRLALESGRGTVHIVLDYVESLVSHSENKQDARGRVLEDFRLRVLPSPEPSALELARIQLSPSPKLAVAGAGVPWYPGPNEIDNRFRLELEPQATRHLSVGLVTCGSADELDPAHLEGFYYWLRNLRLSGVRSVLLTGETKELPAADLLYVTGSGAAGIDSGAAKKIVDQRKKGAWLFADACGTGSELTDALRSAGIGRESPETQHRVLTTHFVFGEAPSGASEAGEIVWGENAVISLRDFGCAWAGRRGKKALPREGIRSAMEFGVNVAICASRETSSL